MVKRKLNCWEYQACGRDSGRTDGEEPCPASTTEVLDGINGGTAGGRSCWVVTGTLCEGCVQGTYEEKYAAVCRKCSFHYRVEVEEGLDYQSADEVLELYRGESERVVS